MPDSLQLLQQTYVDSLTDFIRLGVGILLIFMASGLFLSFIRGSR